MWPILTDVRFGDVTRPLTSYGVCALLGVFFGILACLRAARRLAFPRPLAFSAALVSVAAGLVGAKLLFLAVSLPDIARLGLGPLLGEGGFVFYGGLLGGALAAFAHVRAGGHSPAAFADAAVPGLAIGHAFGRLGCFLIGCCHGRPTGLPWGVSFPEGPFFSGPAGVPLHPVQLYEAAFEGALALSALLALRLGIKPRRGRLFLAWGVAYGAFRLVMELAFRGDDRGFGSETLPPSALLSILLVAGAGLALLHGRFLDTKAE